MEKLNDLMQIYPKPPTSLYVNRTALTEDAARGIAEASKLAMFGISPKKSLFGPKPETLVKVARVEKRYDYYLRVGGVYSIEYMKKNFYPITVDPNVVEVVSGSRSYQPENGVARIEADERKIFQKEGVVAYNHAADEIPLTSVPTGELEANAKAALDLARINPESFARLEETTLSMSVNVFKFRICQTPDEIGQVVKETLSFSEFAMIFTPIYVITLEEQRTKAAKIMEIDGVTGRPL